MRSLNFMDEQLQAEQYARTGNLMDLCHNEAWLQDAAQVEDDCEGNVEAGASMRGYAAWLKKSPFDRKQQMRLQSILFSELHGWMQTWRLGASFEETYTVARRLIRNHLSEGLPEQADWVERLLIEDAQGLSEEKPVRRETVKRLSQILTLEDWHSLATVASRAMSVGVLSVMDGSVTSSTIK